MSRLNATSSKIFLSSYVMKEIMRNIVEQVSFCSWFCNAIARHVKRVKHFTLQDMCSVCSVNLAITSQGVSKNAGHHRITIRDMCLEAQHGTVGKHNLHTIQNESLWYISIYILIHPAHESLPFIWLTLGVKVTPARHCKGVLWSYDVLWKVCRNPWATLCLIALGSSVQGHNNSFQIVEGHINGLKHSHNISKYDKICQNSKCQNMSNVHQHPSTSRHCKTATLWASLRSSLWLPGGASHSRRSETPDSFTEHCQASWDMGPCSLSAQPSFIA